MTKIVGVGSPGCVPGAEPELVLDWARRADDGPFGSLGVVDRLVYGNDEPLVTLAAAAAVTSRLRLATMILIAPLHETAALAKQAATLDRLSGGRLTLGVSIGARPDDYARAGVAYRERGRRLDRQLTELRAYWEDPTVGPAPAQQGGPCVLVGGLGDAALARMARFGDGYAHAGGPPRAFAGAAERARTAWADAGRPGEPLLWGMGYFALGEAAAEPGRDYVRSYYSFTGAFAERIAAGVLTTPRSVTEMVSVVMGLGTAFGGFRIIHTMGYEITKLEPRQGFAAEVGASVVILIASALGMPVSSTHMIAGSITGVGAAKGRHAVKWVTAHKMVLAWFLTLPGAALISAISYKLLLNIFSSVV